MIFHIFFPAHTQGTGRNMLGATEIIVARRAADSYQGGQGGPPGPLWPYDPKDSHPRPVTPPRDLVEAAYRRPPWLTGSYHPQVTLAEFCQAD